MKNCNFSQSAVETVKYYESLNLITNMQLAQWFKGDLSK
jgi:hypothetical protein